MLTANPLFDVQEIKQKTGGMKGIHGDRVQQGVFAMLWLSHSCHDFKSLAASQLVGDVVPLPIGGNPRLTGQRDSNATG